MRRKWKTRLLHLYFLFARPLTLGVRVVLTNDDGHILLVRHGYVAGWHLPGGGIEKGETALAAVRKELVEETGIEPAGQAELLAVIANRRASGRDHVLLYRVRKWRQVREFVANREIRETGFFALDALPDDTTEPTRQRIEEVFGKKPHAEYW